MKLIDLLVKELPKRGGWPEGALNATQDKDGEVCFSAGAVPEFGYAAWAGGDWCGNEFYTIRASDYATAIVTREQYEASLAASKAVVGHDGWIQWTCGDCPVDSDAIVEVKYRKPNPCQFNNDRAGDFSWAHDGIDGDIIAYRLQNPTKSDQVRADAWRSYAGITENDDESDLNECIGQDVDVINHPSHYTQGGIECIDAIKAALGEEQYEGYLRGACIKYLWRYKMKSGVESLKKSEWYLKRLIELNEEIESRNK